jgi:hypothetical protein
VSRRFHGRAEVREAVLPIFRQGVFIPVRQAKAVQPLEEFMGGRLPEISRLPADGASQDD